MIRINSYIVELLDENDKPILEQQYYADEFIWVFRSKEPICLYRHNNEIFYDALNEIMDNEYIFQENTCSLKTKNKLVWLSDQYCDLENSESLSRVNRLVIERKDECFEIGVINPMYDKLGIYKSVKVISFSPMFNGYYAKNTKTNTSLQDDFAMMYQNILHSYIKIKKR